MGIQDEGQALLTQLWDTFQYEVSKPTSKINRRAGTQSLKLLAFWRFTKIFFFSGIGAGAIWQDPLSNGQIFRTRKAIHPLTITSTNLPEALVIKDAIEQEGPATGIHD